MLPCRLMARTYISKQSACPWMPTFPKTTCSFLCFHSGSPQRPTFWFNYSSTWPHMHLFINRPVYFDTFIPTNRYRLPVRFATALHTYTGLPIHQYIPIQFNLPFRQNTHNYLSANLMVYVPTNVPENRPTCVPRWLFFRLTTKTYLAEWKTLITRMYRYSTSRWICS